MLKKINEKRKIRVKLWPVYKVGVGEDAGEGEDIGVGEDVGAGTCHSPNETQQLDGRHFPTVSNLRQLDLTAVPYHKRK